MPQRPKSWDSHYASEEEAFIGRWLEDIVTNAKGFFNLEEFLQAIRDVWK